jgi:nucleoside-diphosphate-sugar epimerase
MRIRIIGAGMIGSTLSKLWVDAGHDVRLASRHPDNLLPLIQNWEGARPPALRRNPRNLVTSSCWQFRSRGSQASLAILRLR